MLEVRLLKDIDEIAFCEDIQKAAWGMHDAEVVPAPQINALYYSGGMVAGAFDGSKLVGFILGFLAKHAANPNPNAVLERDDVGIHSHMMAVLPDYQGQGIGRRLKWFQRDWCLSEGYNWVSWTFDPLQAKNAKLNFEYFGVFANHYKVNVYGEMRDDLNRGMESDRLLAWWDLQAESVQDLSEGKAQLQENTKEIPYALKINEKSLVPNLELDEKIVRLEIHKNLVVLLQTDLDFAHACRKVTRDVFLHYFAKGYTAKRFVESSYILYLP